jgi:hypothetical protein
MVKNFVAFEDLESYVIAGHVETVDTSLAIHRHHRVITHRILSAVSNEASIFLHKYFLPAAATLA